jgi:hypothetical protein
VICHWGEHRRCRHIITFNLFLVYQRSLHFITSRLKTEIHETVYRFSDIFKVTGKT